MKDQTMTQIVNEEMSIMWRAMDDDEKKGIASLTAAIDAKAQEKGYAFRYNEVDEERYGRAILWVSSTTGKEPITETWWGRQVVVGEKGYPSPLACIEWEVWTKWGANLLDYDELNEMLSDILERLNNAQVKEVIWGVNTCLSMDEWRNLAGYAAG